MWMCGWVGVCALTGGSDRDEMDGRRMCELNVFPSRIQLFVVLRNLGDSGEQMRAIQCSGKCLVTWLLMYIKVSGRLMYSKLDK